MHNIIFHSQRLLFFIVGILWGLLLIGGCAAEDANPILDIVDITDRFQSEAALESRAGEISVSEYVLPMPEGSEIGDQTVYGDKIYYVVFYMERDSDQVQFPDTKLMEIYNYDTITGQHQPIFHCDEQSGKYINELRANKDFLFWNLLAPGTGWKLYQYNLDHNTASIFISKENDDTISLSDRYLAWYEVKQVEDQIEYLLMVYDLEKAKLQTIEDGCYLPSPYYRANIRNNHVTFLTGDEKNTYVNIFDLETDHKEILTIPKKSVGDKDYFIGYAVSNGLYTALQEYVFYGGALGQSSNVYVYDHDADTLYLINSDTDGQHAFSIDLVKHYVLLNDTMAGYIYCFDLLAREKINLTAIKNPYIVTVAADNKAISHSLTNEGVGNCLIVEFLTP